MSPLVGIILLIFVFLTVVFGLSVHYHGQLQIGKDYNKEAFRATLVMIVACAFCASSTVFFGLEAVGIHIP